jgi:hypothetical protein
MITPESATRDATRFDDRHELAAIPVLGLVAMAAALIDLWLNGVLLRTVGDGMSHATLIEVARWGDLPRNLSAIAGLVALPASLVGYLATRRWANIQRRLVIAGFAGLFLPIVALATLLSPEVLPHDDRTIKLVKVGIGAANVLAVLVGLIAVRRAAPAGVRLGVLFATASCFLAFAALAIAEIRWISHTQWGVISFYVVRRLGEGAYLLMPIAVAMTLLPRTNDLRGRIALGAGALVAAVVAALVGWGILGLRGDFDIVLYGAQRLELFSDGAQVLGIPLTVLYVLPLAIGFGAGTAGLASTDPGRRQAGVAILLLLAAGFAPRSPAPLLSMVLGVVLLSRASIALGEPRLVRKRDERERIEAPVEDAVADLEGL